MLYANRDDFFIRYDEKFRIYPSEEKDDVMDELLSDPDIAGSGRHIRTRWILVRTSSLREIPTGSSRQLLVDERCQRRTSYLLSSSNASFGSPEME